jgi:hypothetical protein
VGRPPVAIVSESAARRLWPDQDPLGRRLFLGAASDAPPDSAAEVVGVVADVRYLPSAFRIEPDIYTPYYQFASLAYAMVVMRAPGPPAGLLPAVRGALREVDQGLPLFDYGPLEARGDRQLQRRRLNAVLLAAFAALGLAIATVGVYGVVNHLAARRTREFAIRRAVGAGFRGILGLVLGRASVLIGAGLMAGLAAALMLTRFLRSQLFDVAPNDPLTFAGIAAVLAAAALVASYVPARRAARVDPVAALRAE